MWQGNVPESQRKKGGIGSLYTSKEEETSAIQLLVGRVMIVIQAGKNIKIRISNIGIHGESRVSIYGFPGSDPVKHGSFPEGQKKVIASRQESILGRQKEHSRGTHFVTSVK